jgi:arylsulfatase A-like enzyme
MMQGVSVCAVLIPFLGMAEARCAASDLAADRPNVVFIMPDDISYDAVSYYNKKGPRTPNLDRLARRSVRLTDFHVSPTCSETRAALLTGRYNNATGVWHTYVGRSLLRGDEVTVADVFQANGYATGLFGKWHLGENYPSRPKDNGFEYIACCRGGGVGQAKDYWGNSNHPPSKYWVNDKLVPLVDEDDGIPGALSTNFFTSRAIEFMQQEAGKGKPFFAYLPYNAAHGPIDRMPPDARRGIDWKTAMIENIDKNVGRVLKFLHEKRLADNTIVIFTTDNGNPSGRFRGGKSSHYDGGHRVPCFVRWPAGGIGGSEDPGRDVRQLLAHIDWLPTLMQLLQLHDVPKRPAQVPLHGHSFASLLDIDSANDAPIFSTRSVVVNNQRVETMTKYKDMAVMRDQVDAEGNIAHKWRLVRKGAGAKYELYDVQSDPRQRKNLAAVPAYVDVKKRMAAEYERWWKLVSARADEYVRPVLGHDAQPDACLWGFDWLGGKGPWSQRLVAGAARSNGFWAVDFAEGGTYRFDLRRWPKEIQDNTTITSGYDKPLITGEKGKPLPIAKAKIRIYTDEGTVAEESVALPPDVDGPVFVLKDISPGPCFVQTSFYDESGRELCGAYYVYVHKDRS